MDFACVSTTIPISGFSALASLYCLHVQLGSKKTLLARKQQASHRNIVKYRSIFELPAYITSSIPRASASKSLGAVTVELGWKPIFKPNPPKNPMGWGPAKSQEPNHPSEPIGFGAKTQASYVAGSVADMLLRRIIPYLI